jgi:hypothetical protein
MGNWYQTKQAAKSILLAITLICVSCNSYKQVSSYPMVNSVDQKKFSFLAINHHKSAHQKSLKKNNYSFDLSSTSHINWEKTRIDSAMTQLRSIPILCNLRSTNRINWFPISSNNQETMTASLTTVPIIRRYYSIPDTSKTHDSLTIDSTQIKTTQIQPTNQYDYFDRNAKKLKQRETFANISLIAAIASIVTLFAIPILFIPLAIAAIVFGALGLKSSKKKRARSGMLIGIIMIILFTLFVLAYAGAFS